MKPIDLTYEITRCFINDHRGCIDNNVISTISGYHRSRNLIKLASCSEIFDSALHSVDEWRFLRQIEAFFKKNVLFAAQDECFKRAEENFFLTESLCFETNRRLKEYVSHVHLLDEPIRSYIYKMQHYIHNVLGDFHSFLEQLPSLIKVTSGATSTSNRRNSVPPLKIKRRYYATNHCVPYVRAVLSYFGEYQHGIRRTRSNRIELVPKNWKTHRTIACEPEGNLPLQLAFDTWTKRRLRRYGINLRDQDNNKLLARHASVFNDLATVDFSAASDTISFNTVSLIFPEDWLKFLCDVRTGCYRGVFGTGVYHKFSSMGNGCTFCIETLLFAAACYAVGSKRFSVYGDDVIIESELLNEYTELTRFLGFRINVEKSYHQGPFRESCGGDFYHGIDVTPKYIRNIDKRKVSYCHLVNTLCYIATPYGELEQLLIRLVRIQRLPLVPYNENTLSGVHIEPRKCYRRGILRWKNYISKFKSYVPLSRKVRFPHQKGYYLWFLNANSQVDLPIPWNSKKSEYSVDTTETSSVALFSHRYRRKWVHWMKPVAGTPSHLERWTELVTSH